MSEAGDERTAPAKEQPADYFKKGCEKALNEFCGGHQYCVIPAIKESSENGNDTEKGGYEECKEFIELAKSQGIGEDANRAIARMKAKLVAINAELAKEFPFISITADFARLELEELARNAKYMAGHGRDAGRDRSIIVPLQPSDDSKEFEKRYLYPARNAIYNLGNDKAGKAALKSKIKEIRFLFMSEYATTDRANVVLRVVDRVLQVPGVFSVDSTKYPSSIQKFIANMR